MSVLVGTLDGVKLCPVQILGKTRTRPLQIFLCHASEDKPAVRQLYQELRAVGTDPWLDEESIVPGQEWDRAIKVAVQASDVVIVVLSEESIRKTGYVQKEIKRVLEVAQEHPEGEIFVIPLRLNACTVPDQLSGYQAVDLQHPNGRERLSKALLECARRPEIRLPSPIGTARHETISAAKENIQPGGLRTLELFMQAAARLGDPNKHVRVSGIHVLDILLNGTNSSDAYQWQILDTLAAFIRENAPAAAGATPHSNSPWALTAEQLTPCVDVQAALNVMVRRVNISPRENDSPLDLCNSDLCGAWLEGAHLEWAYLENTRLDGAIIRRANLTQAILYGTSFKNCDLRGAIMSDVYVRNTDVSGADLRDVQGLGHEHLEKLHGDRDTQLPIGLVMPEAWAQTSR